MLSLSQLQARELSGKPWQLNGSTFTFADYDRNVPGQPPWKTGAEGIAYPLLNGDGRPTAYVKFFDALKMTPKRVLRTQWLIDQRLDRWARELRGAPHFWVDTKAVGAPDGVSFDFTCSLAEAVPGRTWLELKVDVMDGLVSMNEELQRRCVEDLLRGLVVLEQNGMVHGDLSPNNVIINLHAAHDAPTLYLIDFDAFLAPHAGDLASLSAGEGGTFGTEGYCPPQLFQRVQQDPAQAAPFSDFYARDMLLLELLCFDSDCDFEAPPIQWDRGGIVSKLNRSSLGQCLTYLLDRDIFQRAEERRPTNQDLARAIKLVLPPQIQRAGQSHSSTSLPRNLNDNELLRRAEKWMRSGICLLWLLCVVHVGLVAFWFSGWLISDASSSAHSFFAAGARLFLTTAAFLGGVAGLSIFAFAAEEPRLIQVVGYWFRIPARRDSTQSELRHLGGVATTLMLFLITLGGFAILLART